MRNAGVARPENIQGYLLGIPGTYRESSIPAWMGAYRIDRSNPGFHHPFGTFSIPWNEGTGDILNRIIEEVDDEVIKRHAEWGRDAWMEWQEQLS